MDESGVISSTCDDLFDAIFLTESLYTTDKLDLGTIFHGEMFGVGTNLIAQGLGEACEVENPDVVPVEIKAHSIRMAPAGNRAGDNDAVEAGETSGYLLGITIL